MNFSCYNGLFNHLIVVFLLSITFLKRETYCVFLFVGIHRQLQRTLCYFCRLKVEMLNSAGLPDKVLIFITLFLF